MTVIVTSTQCLLCLFYNHNSYDGTLIRCVKIESVPDAIVFQQETFLVKPALVLNYVCLKMMFNGHNNDTSRHHMINLQFLDYEFPMFTFYKLPKDHCHIFWAHFIER